MGFLWSQPELDLREERQLHDSLLESEPELIFRSGDLLLVPSTDLEITLNGEPWSHVAIIVIKNQKIMAFTNGVYEDVRDFVENHTKCTCRPLQCIREMGFDRRILDASERAANILLERTHMRIDYREGFCVGTLLGIMGLADLEGLAQGRLRPHHFSSDTPFNRLKLHEYTQEHWTIVL